MDAAAVTGARNWDSVRERHPERVARLEAGLVQGDPLADAVIVEARQQGISFSTLVALLEANTETDTPTDPDHLEMPASMARLLEVAGEPPPWFDPAFAAAGARAWWRFGTLQSSTLYQSLIYGFKAQGFVRPLVATGRLGSGTRDRVQSTARWVAEATTPGSMLPGHPGWVATLRIRLLHAYIRDVLRHPVDDAEGWDEGEWGAPINQTYSVMTISCGFLALPLVVARDFGIHYSSAEQEAITHLWRWIGWVIGVDDDLLPPSYADARELFQVAGEFELRPDDSSKILIKALLREGYDLPGVVHSAAPVPVPGLLVSAVDTLTRPLLMSSFSAISTRWVERPVARRMGLRRTPLHHLVDVARPAVRLREIARATGLLGSESTVIERELRTVRRGLGMTEASETYLSA
ncbi:oxygenase MpaB family protein [Gordonia sp. 'Campus']|uniref:oxygenase MpaB family protein n=1 Tax=Gordonia sp. 'Campus' TaxID=2915824 RepID=UPI001EE40B3C|nr:oxygenase MpaB family protein [Gordonia sp. 'Campus']